VPRLAHQAYIAARIVVDYHAHMEFSFVVLLNGFHSRDFSLKRDIENIAASSRPEPDAIAAANGNAENFDGLDRIFIF
jgi:uncharacterized membrane protein YebE (DUF533 family)